MVRYTSNSGSSSRSRSLNIKFKMNGRFDSKQRGRGGFRGRGFRKPPVSQPAVDAALPRPGPSQRLLNKIPLTSITKVIKQADNLKIKATQYVASYNWKEDKNTTILVPGRPPRWQPPTTPQQLHEDGGLYYRDPNSARYPEYPTEPAIQAIQQVDPSFPLTETSIFGCGSTLGSLLSFVRAEDRTFRFGVELLGDTLFLVRKTNTPGELLEDVHGYGHTFPETYTSWDRDVRGSASHQRLISYEFGGMKFVVRSESDGYLPQKVDKPQKSDRSKGDEIHDGISDNDIHEKLLSLAFGPKPPGDAVLKVEEAGIEIPQPAIFDLKTRSIKRKAANGVDEFLHRLWLNQTPNMILAYHQWGTFDHSQINVIDVRDRLKRWEESNVAVLAKFAGVLRDLMAIGKENGTFEVRRIATGPLEIWSEVQGWSVLPRNLKAIWNGDVDKHVDSKSTEEAVNEDENTSVDSSDDSDEDYLKF